MMQWNATKKAKTDCSEENNASEETELNLKESITEFWLYRKERMKPTMN
ncbi:MAG: hypothetical protein KGY80_12190 [Candidatus Thorarchaeota archaeon]|nr:hypothetical protein [Candidatus Thorarchaeota archaeon]